MFYPLYFSIFVLFIASIGICINPTSKFAKYLLFANIFIVLLNVVQLQEKMGNQQKDDDKFKITTVS